MDSVSSTRDSMKDTNESRQEDQDDTPALFMTTVPKDVWANPSLAALAALIDETNEEAAAARAGETLIQIFM